MTFSNARDMIEIRKLYKEPEYYQDMITMSIDQIYEKYMQATETSDIIFYGYLGKKKVNAKSIMGMMTLGLDAGEEITLSANGEDEDAAMSSIEQYLSNQ